MKIAIASGKGGTGKTTLSSNLAKYLARDYNVVLTDLDVEEPNAGLFVGREFTFSENKFKMIPEWAEEKCGACGICQEVCNFNAVLLLGDLVTVFPELCHSCYACSELCPNSALPMKPKKMGELQHFKTGNFNFVEGKLSIGEEQAAPLIKQTKKFVEKKFDETTIRIFDSPPGTSCPVIESVKDMDLVILVAEPTPFGFHDLKLAVETMEELDKEFCVVINKYGIGSNQVEEFCEMEGIPIAAKIPNDKRIAESYARGGLLYEDFPEIKIELEKIKNFIFDLLGEAVK